MRSFVTLAALLFSILRVGAAATGPDGPYQEIRVALDPGGSPRVPAGYTDLELMGLGDGDARFLSTPSLTEELRRDGWAVTLVHSDLEGFYSSRLKAAQDHGPWYSYDEAVEEIFRLHDQYPEIVRAPFSIGQSHEGREIWALKISDAPALDEDEPEVLFDAIHHAREIMSVELVLFYARYLCENYRSDSLVTFLVDHREVFFVPVVNPDGFVYNEQTHPGGGGMWRKNRRANAGGCFGVDNNRNYPFAWGQTGSSWNPCDNTYRGTEPASEPENRAMITFISGRRFVTHNSIHSVMGSLLMPWCHTFYPTPDDERLRALAAGLTSKNGYLFGQCPEILYAVSGGFIDWAYGEEGVKPKIYSFTTEIGGSGFWPAFSERDGLLQENLHSMLYLTLVAGPAVLIDEIRLTDQDRDFSILPGEMVELSMTLRNEGLAAQNADASVRIRCDDPYIALTTASNRLDALAPGEAMTTSNRPLIFRVEGECPASRQVPFTVELDSPGSLPIREAFEITVQSPDPLYANEFEKAGDGWFSDAGQTASAGAFVRIEPMPTAFQPGTDATFPGGSHAWVTGQNIDVGEIDVDGGIASTRSPTFDLSSYDGVRLTMAYFHGQRDGGDDPEGDFFRIDLSSDGGDSWVNLVRIGDQASRPEWRRLSIELTDFIDLTASVVFRVQVSDGPSDGDIIEGGIDAFVLTAADERNRYPERPRTLWPVGGADSLSSVVVLAVENASDPDDDPLRYGFRAYADPDLSDEIARVDGVPEAEGSTSWVIPLHLGVGTYYWRAYAADPHQRGLFSGVATFTVRDTAAWPDLPLFDAPALSVGPNPSKSMVTIRYFVPVTMVSRLEIYEAQGRLVRTFPPEASQPGWHELIWDGTNDGGRRVAHGPYWLQLWTPEEKRTLKVIRLE